MAAANLYYLQSRGLEGQPLGVGLIIDQASGLSPESRVEDCYKRLLTRVYSSQPVQQRSRRDGDIELGAGMRSRQRAEDVGRPGDAVERASRGPETRTCVATVGGRNRLSDVAEDRSHLSNRVPC
jgi:hypothetical protein